MECRETQTLLTAFHDGELTADGHGWPSAGAGKDAPGSVAPAAERARVEEHLRGCPECRALLADLARADRAAGVPDPGPAYWDRFNARVMDRVEREADGPGVTVLRPKHGWMREQLRYLVPAAAAAALVVVIVYYGGMDSGAPPPAAPPAVSKPAAPPPAIAEERLVTAAREERDRLPDRTLSEAKERTSRDRAAAPAAINAPSDGHGWPSAGTGRDAPDSAVPAPAAEPQLAAKAESASGMKMAKADPSPLASAPSYAAPPCELARTLAARKRWKEAEAAQRACLAQDRSAPAQEKGLVFLAELLDRQERFADADVVIKEVDRQFPKSRPLDLYRQQRPMVHQQPTAVPVTR